MNAYTAVQYLRATIDEMTMNEFIKLPPKQRIEFCRAALKATEGVTNEEKEVPALFKPILGCGDAPHC